jgi:Flp pilus assembly protein CpaB
MSVVEIIIGVIGAIVAAAAGGFGIGHIRGTSKAEAKADKQRTEENAAATVAVAERRVEVIKEASNVQQTVNRMPDDDVDRELRDTWKRPGGG